MTDIDALRPLLRDLVLSFLYYDRTEDEDIPLEAIERAVDGGAVTVDDIVAGFRDELIKGLATLNRA